MFNATWFKRPGQLSILIPNDGIAQLCNTSEEVTSIRILVFIGSNNGLSTSNKRNCGNVLSSEDSI
jgi:hypothetical protein